MSCRVCAPRHRRLCLCVTQCLMTPLAGCSRSLPVVPPVIGPPLTALRSSGSYHGGGWYPSVVPALGVVVHLIPFQCCPRVVPLVLERRGDTGSARPPRHSVGSTRVLPVPGKMCIGFFVTASCRSRMSICIEVARCARLPGCRAVCGVPVCCPPVLAVHVVGTSCVCSPSGGSRISRGRRAACRTKRSTWGPCLL